MNMPDKKEPTPSVCPNCKGTGSEYRINPRTGQTGLTTCSLCKGTGK